MLCETLFNLFAYHVYAMHVKVLLSSFVILRSSKKILQISLYMENIFYIDLRIEYMVPYCDYDRCVKSNMLSNLYTAILTNNNTNLLRLA